MSFDGLKLKLELKLSGSGLRQTAKALCNVEVITSLNATYQIVTVSSVWDSNPSVSQTDSAVLRDVKWNDGRFREGDTPATSINSIDFEGVASYICFAKAL